MRAENRPIGETDGSRLPEPRATGRPTYQEVRASPVAGRRFGIQRLGKLCGFPSAREPHHQRNVERIAVIVGHDWQNWVVDVARMFLHPEARAFHESREEEAQRWLVGV